MPVGSQTAALRRSGHNFVVISVCAAFLLCDATSGARLSGVARPEESSHSPRRASTAVAGSSINAGGPSPAPAATAPSVTAFSPQSASEAGGASIAVTATGLPSDGATGVACIFGGVATAAEVKGGQALCLAPRHKLNGAATAGVCLAISVPNGGTNVSSACASQQLVYFKPPTVSSFSPLGSAKTSSSLVTVRGSGFSVLQGKNVAATPKCRFSTRAMAATIVNDTTLTCQSPVCIHDICPKDGAILGFPFCVSLNGADFSCAPRDFEFWTVLQLESPPDPPVVVLGRDVAVNVSANLMRTVVPDAPVLCRFVASSGTVVGTVPAIVVTPYLASCRVRKGLAEHPGETELWISLNGQAWEDSHARIRFLDVPSIKSVAPASVSGYHRTGVTLTVDGLDASDDLVVAMEETDALVCRFGDIDVVGAFDRDRGNAVECLTPQLPHPGGDKTSLDVQLELSVDGGQTWTAAAPFTFRFDTPTNPIDCNARDVCSLSAGDCTTGWCNEGQCNCWLGWGGENCHDNVRSEVVGLAELSALPDFACSATSVDLASAQDTVAAVEAGCIIMCITVIVAVAVPFRSLPPWCPCGRAIRVQEVLRVLVRRLDFKLPLRARTVVLHSDSVLARSGRESDSEDDDNEDPVLAVSDTVKKDVEDVAGGRPTGYGVMRKRGGHRTSTSKLVDYDAETMPFGERIVYVKRQNPRTIGGVISLVLAAVWVAQSAGLIASHFGGEDITSVQSQAALSRDDILPLRVSFGFDCSPATRRNCSQVRLVFENERDMTTCGPPPDSDDDYVPGAPGVELDAGAGECFCEEIEVAHGKACVVQYVDGGLTVQSLMDYGKSFITASSALQKTYTMRFADTSLLWPPYVLTSVTSLSADEEWLDFDSLDQFERLQLFRTSWCSQLAQPPTWTANEVAFMMSPVHRELVVEGDAEENPLVQTLLGGAGGFGSGDGSDSGDNEPDPDCRWQAGGEEVGDDGSTAIRGARLPGMPFKLYGNLTVSVHAMKTNVFYDKQITAKHGIDFQYDFNSFTWDVPKNNIVERETLPSSSGSYAIRVNFDPTQKYTTVVSATTLNGVLLHCLALAGSFVGAHALARVFVLRVVGGYKEVAGASAPATRRDDPRGYVDLPDGADDGARGGGGGAGHSAAAADGAGVGVGDAEAPRSVSPSGGDGRRQQSLAMERAPLLT